jgi:tetratricopeptide (TPR) repeat protein
VKWTPIKIFVFALILVFYGSILAHKINLPMADDLPRQMKIGELLLQGNWDLLYTNVLSYVEPDHFFFNHHWFSGILFFLLYQVIGWSGLVVFKVVMFLTAFSLIFFTALKKADFWLVSLFSLPALIVILERTGLRPEVFSYVFVATYLYLLIDLDDHPDRKWIYGLIPLQMFWVNMHVFFSIGIMMVAGFLFEKIVLNWNNRAWLKSPLVQKLGIVFLGVLGISLLNPRGIAGVLYRYPANFPIVISENRSLDAFVSQETFWEDPAVAMVYGCVGLLILSYVIAFRQKQYRIFFALASLATSLLVFNILRSLTLFGFMFLPAVTANFNGSFLALKEWIAREMPNIAKYVRRGAIAILIGAFVFLIYPGWAPFVAYKVRGVGLVPWAEDAANFFKENNLHGPIFNDADVGSYLIWYLYPEEKVFTDNRFGDAYSASFYEDIATPMISDEYIWQNAMLQYDFNVIFYNHYDGAAESRPFVWRRLHDPEWVLVHADPAVVILVRDLPENAAVIEQFRITPENVEERLQYLITSPSFTDRAAAADLMNLVGRNDLARELFLQIALEWPDRGRIWAVLGQMARDENTEEASVLALMLFQRAIQEGRGTAENYGFLGAMYMRMGMRDQALEALRRSLEINPARQDILDMYYDVTAF